MVSLEPKIIKLLSKDLKALYSVSDIARELSVAYSHAYLFVKRLLSDDILKITKIGKTAGYKLNMQNPLTLAKLAEQSYHKTLKWAQKDARAEKFLQKSEIVRENVHTIIIHNAKAIIIVPENAKDVNLAIFKNRKVLTPHNFLKEKDFYSDAIIIHGAEKYWSLIKDA